MTMFYLSYMNLPFFSKFFQKEPEALILPNSILIKKLKNITRTHQFNLYTNITIYHHTQNHFIPLLLLDSQRGLYIFERKKWNFKDLKNASIEKAKNQQASENTLSYQNTQNIIHQKLKELTHQDNVSLFNYLLMENLSTQEYMDLDDSLKKLLPQKTIIFNDTSEEEIQAKLQMIKKSQKPLPKQENIIGNLLIQYTHLDDNGELKLSTQEQINFLNTPITSTSNIIAKKATGKSSTFLLKAILTILQEPNKKIVIIKPTQLSADILKRKLLEIIEHAIIEIDLSSISIMTPLELVNLHHQKLKKNLLIKKPIIDPLLMKKKFHIADMIFCDDTNLLQEDFVNYLFHIQKEKALIVVNSKIQTQNFQFTKKFTSKHREIYFLQTNPYAKALHLISKLLKTSKASEIIVVSNSKNKNKLHEDLEFFIKDKTFLLDSSKNLIDQELNTLFLTTYKDIVGLKAKHVILLDLCIYTGQALEFAFELASESVYILYDKNCNEISTLKENYENNKN